MNQYTRIMMVGGGTGGHFYPLISLAQHLNSIPNAPRLYYIGPTPYDPEALRRERITFVSCRAGKQRRYFSLLNFLDAFKIFFGFFEAALKLFIIYPDVVVSKGGYTSVPVVVAAWFLRIPIIVHESDSVAGRANRLGARFARVVAVSYPDMVNAFPRKEVVLTGIPLRRELLAPQGAYGTLQFHLDDTLPTILVLGGSQGAERVNELILDSLDELLPLFSVIHQTGRAHFEVVSASASKLVLDPVLRSRYHAVPFFDGHELNEALHRSHFVVSRAGSTSIYEIAVHGKPSIIIPIPEGISHDQRSNAYAYARAGAAVVMEEHNLKDSLLATEIERIMRDQALYATMSQRAYAFAPQNGAEALAQIITKIATTH